MDKIWSLQVKVVQDILPTFFQDNKPLIHVSESSGILYTTIVPTPSAWPLNMISYMGFKQDNVECNDALHVARFYYWEFGNKYLDDPTVASGI
jgi:hypothetical protein